MTAMGNERKVWTDWAPAAVRAPALMGAGRVLGMQGRVPSRSRARIRQLDRQGGRGQVGGASDLAVRRQGSKKMMAGGEQRGLGLTGACMDAIRMRPSPAAEEREERECCECGKWDWMLGVHGALGRGRTC